MGFNDRDKPGWSLKECKHQGVKTVTVRCLKIGCNHEHDFPIDTIETRGNGPAPTHLPSNYLPWRCKKCRGTYVRVTAIPGA